MQCNLQCFRSAIFQKMQLLRYRLEIRVIWTGETFATLVDRLSSGMTSSGPIFGPNVLTDVMVHIFVPFNRSSFYRCISQDFWTNISFQIFENSSQMGPQLTTIGYSLQLDWSQVENSGGLKIQSRVLIRLSTYEN